MIVLCYNSLIANQSISSSNVLPDKGIQCKHTGYQNKPPKTIKCNCICVNLCVCVCVCHQLVTHGLLNAVIVYAEVSCCRYTCHIIIYNIVCIIDISMAPLSWRLLLSMPGDDDDTGMGRSRLGAFENKLDSVFLL